MDKLIMKKIIVIEIFVSFYLEVRNILYIFKKIYDYKYM